MARPIRPAPTPATPSAGPSTLLRTSARHRQSASASAACSGSASTPGPPTPQSDGAGARGSGSARKGAQVEAKAHGLRSTGSAVERQPCPFPAQWGGRANCGISEEDETDEVLMGTLSAIAFYDNRALSAEEVAHTCFQQGWLRPPSAAIEPSTLINNAIRSYMKRCEKAKRHCLLAKYQLSGSAVESVLEVALHPSAFDESSRPKGTVWYLLSGSGSGSGKTKWKSPFDGLEIPKMPPRKPTVPKKKEVKRVDDKKSGKDKGKEKPLAPVKIRLVLPGGNGEDSSDRGSMSRSRSISVGKENLMRNEVEQSPASLPRHTEKTVPRKPREIDSSTDSDSSDSDLDILPSSRLRNVRPLRKGPPPPLIVHGSPRVHGSTRLPHQSSFMDLFHTSPTMQSGSHYAAPHMSPFPSHSLDNTTWTARHDRHRFASSSSSSEEEIIEPEWGVISDVLIREAVEDDDSKAKWSVEDEAKVKEATDALRVLFPLEEPDELMGFDGAFELGKIDVRPSRTDSPGVSEPASNTTTTTARAGLRNKLKVVDAGGLALNTWVNSSPIPSPRIRPFRSEHALPIPDFSPTQQFSRLRGSFDPEESMDVDEEQWLDESGELPVKAEDSFSDIDIGSTIDEVASPEHDRRLHTALWAQEAAAIFQVKSEPEDFPTPSSIEDEPMQRSREGSTPSYSTSESPDYDEGGGWINVDEIIVGPESVSVEELDGWLPTNSQMAKTPHRGRVGKGKKDKADGTRWGAWGGIGVCSAGKRTSRLSAVPGNNRRRKSKSCCMADRLLTPESDTAVDKPAGKDEEVEVADAIGTEDFDKARAEADEREEEHRKTCKEKAERHRAMLEAYRQTVRAEMADSDVTPSPWESSHIPPWGSDSLQLPTPGVLSPMVLHNISNLSLSSPNEQPMAVDPKALVSPPLQGAFGGVGLQGDVGMGFGMGMLDAALTQQEVDAIMGVVPAVVPLPPVVPTPSTSSPATATPVHQIVTQTVPRSSAGSAPGAPVPVQATTVPTVSASAPTEKDQSMTVHTSAGGALKATVPHVGGAKPTPIATSAKPTIPVNTSLPASKSAPMSVSATPSRSSTPNTATSSSSTNSSNVNGNGNKSGGKIATITKPLCPGVDACVVDNIPVYAHIFDGRNGSGKQVLLRRLDTDFVNANALLHALGVSPAKHSEYLDHPISQARLAARHVVPPSTSGVEYSHGVSGIWVHLSEAREFARRAKLAEGILLANVLGEDLFQLFAMLAGLKPDHPPSESFGLPFVPRRHTSPGSTMSTNSKSAPNLPALSSSTPVSNQLRPGAITPSPSTASSTSIPSNAGNANGAVKGSLVRSAAAVPDGCPLPKRRRATISSPLAKKPGVPGPGDGTGCQQSQQNAMAVPAVAAATAIAVGPAMQRRATRASVGGITTAPTTVK